MEMVKGKGIFINNRKLKINENSLQIYIMETINDSFKIINNVQKILRSTKNR